MKGSADKCKNSEAPRPRVGCDPSSPSLDVLLSAEESDVPEVIQAPPVHEEHQEDMGANQPDPISNGMEQESAPSAGDRQGGASNLVNNKTRDEPSSPPATRSPDARGQVEPTKPAKPTHLRPDGGTECDVKPGTSGNRTSSEALPSGSEPEPSQSRSVDSLESFSHLNSCPSSEGLEDRGLALALQSEHSSDGTKTSCAKDRAAGQSVYHIKWIKWREENTPIITQNENGPCPLLAIMNVLLLAWKVDVLGAMWKLGFTVGATNSRCAHLSFRSRFHL